MIANMFNKLSNFFSRTGSDHNPAARKSRTNRRCSICRGIEGLEGRLAPSGGFAPSVSPGTADMAPSPQMGVPPTITTVTNDPNDPNVPNVPYQRDISV
jgi:hypothetical protein